jgi:uncharacterized protein YjaG (DUF416 family)
MPSEPSQPNNLPAELRVCEHFELLGISPAIQPDLESSEILHCSLCQLSYQFVIEGSQLIVSAIRPLGVGLEGKGKKDG